MQRQWKSCCDTERAVNGACLPFKDRFLEVSLQKEALVKLSDGDGMGLLFISQLS